MAVVAFRFQRLWVGPALGLVAGVFVASCAAGSPEDSANPPPPSDGGFSGNDGGTEDGSGGTGGTGSGGTGGTGGTAGSAPGAQCETCVDTDDCEDGLICVTSPQGHPFCATDCSNDPCPAGDYECVDLSTYGAGVPDGGIPLSGDGCVPSKGESCSCTTLLEGAQRPCFNTNFNGTCVGTETCTSGSWTGCDAPSAEKEICDGVDNDCNGLTDQEETTVTGNDLCAGGSQPPHSEFACVAGKCELGNCEAGWVMYPPNLPATAGCACAVDAADVDPGTNDQCTGATDLGALADDGGTPLLIQGTLHSDLDVDWYAINAVDANQVPAFNPYRIHVEFLLPDGNPSDEFRFDVIRATAADLCSGEKSLLTSYDWCADSTSDPAAPADDDQTAPYRLKVYRNPGATATCNEYKIRVINGGSGACPAADPCGSS